MASGSDSRHAWSNSPRTRLSARTLTASPHSISHYASGRTQLEPFGCQVPLGVEGGHAAGPGGCDRLAIVIVGDVTGGEDAPFAGEGSHQRRVLNVALLVQLQLSVQKRSVGRMADREEQA